jgi:hypothetical protein
MTTQEKRTLKWGSILLALYLVVFLLTRNGKGNGSTSEYERFAGSETSFMQEVRKLETKELQLEKLNQTFKMDPARFSKTTVVADASAAIQNAATGGGITIGPIRESAARSSAREITSMQIEGVGPVPAAMKFLHQINGLGYPLLIDSLQINPDNSQPGNIKINLTIVILDYEQWKKV